MNWALIFRLAWLLPFTAAAVFLEYIFLSGWQKALEAPIKWLIPCYLAVVIGLPALVFSAGRNTLMALLGKEDYKLGRAFDLLLVLTGGSLLTAVFVPKLADLVRYSQDGAQRGSLGNVRQALQERRNAAGAYYTTREELEPLLATATFRGLWKGGLNIYAHKPTRELLLLGGAAPTDSGKWAYVNDPASPDFGKFFIDCTHPVYPGMAETWSTY
jgi:hypothetical protein